MESIKKQTISGFNEYIDSLKKQKGEFLFSLTKFNSKKIEKPYVAVDIKKVEPLTSKNYNPDQNTPLYDACVETIEIVNAEVEKMDKNMNIAVLTVILTDGEENCSEKHDETCLTDLIKKLEARGNWTFVFLGPQATAWQQAQKMGITQGNVLGWQTTERGTKQMYSRLAGSNANFLRNASANSAKGINTSSMSFFSGGDKDDSQPSS